MGTPPCRSTRKPLPPERSGAAAPSQPLQAISKRTALHSERQHWHHGGSANLFSFESVGKPLRDNDALVSSGAASKVLFCLRHVAYRFTLERGECSSRYRDILHMIATCTVLHREPLCD